MTGKGWIKLHRCLKDKAIFDNEKLLKVFIWCLLKATHKPHKQLIGRQKVLLQPGEFITGRNKAGAELNMPPTTAWEYLKLLEANSSIDIKSNNKFSVVTIENWGLYQTDDKNSDSKPDSKSTANRQQIDTNKNVKNDENKKIINIVESDLPENKKTKKEISNKTNSTIYGEIIDYLNLKAGANYKPTTKATQQHINARLSEGFTADDFKTVIDVKCNDWLNNKEFRQYLRPQTLFGNKFESYLNQRIEPSNKTITYESHSLDDYVIPEPKETIFD